MRHATTLLACAVFATGCLAPTAELNKEEPGALAFDDADAPADSFSKKLILRGTLAFGESVDARYAALGYHGWLFTGARGARVSVAVDGHGSDPVVYLYGPQTSARTPWARRAPVAVNDDAGGSLDSLLTTTLPSAGTYLVLVREYGSADGYFTLTLGCSGAECRAECGASDACPMGAQCNRVVCIRAPCPSFCAAVDPVVACSADSDCTAVTTTCCPCGMGGQEQAANTQYASSLRPVCSAGPQRCRQVNTCGTSAPRCVQGTCRMEQLPPGECAASDCGPRPRTVTIQCDDGSLGGNTGRCLREASGCAWEQRTCPAPTGRACGGRLGATCASNEYCAYAPAAICGRADAMGTCARKPEACTALFDPVCGCDGVTYGNACSAANAGVSVDHTGECVPPAPPAAPACGSRGLAPCPAGTFCVFPVEAMCGATDRPGTCQARPTVCNRLYAPVCGCDGRTYSNECGARAAGTSPASTGPCR